jgi:hypothetical protein
VIQAILYEPDEKKLTEGGAELIDVWESRSDSSIWVALQGEEAELES